MTPEEINDQKKVEFYAASVNAWYNTSLEHDKSIFALSAGGIGLLISLLTTLGVSSSLLLHLYITAIFFLLVSLCALLVIFRRNRTHIEQVLSGQAVRDSVLAWLDLLAILAFGAGVVFTAIIGISAAVNSYESKVTIMANIKPEKASTTANDSIDSATFHQRSFNGVANTQPQPTVTTQNTRPAPTPAPAEQTNGAGTSKGGSGK